MKKITKAITRAGALQNFTMLLCKLDLSPMFITSWSDIDYSYRHEDYRYSDFKHVDDHLRRLLTW